MSDLKDKIKKSETAKTNTDLTDKISVLEQQVAEHLHGWKKALADYQNLQKESAQKTASLTDFITNALVLELLPIFDNYHTAIKHIPEEQKNEAWAVGLKHILKMWEQFLADHDITKIEALGQEFDPRIHEAVDNEHNSDLPDQQITKELQAGYHSKQVIIRPAKVVVNNK